MSHLSAKANIPSPLLNKNRYQYQKKA